MNSTETCIVCGRAVPEGRQICPICYAYMYREKPPSEESNLRKSKKATTRKQKSKDRK